jgi:helix-turn-helix protein
VDKRIVVLTDLENQVRNLKRAGVKQADIARYVGVSKQRVTQIVQRLRKLDVLDDQVGGKK